MPRQRKPVAHSKSRRYDVERVEQAPIYRGATTISPSFTSSGVGYHLTVQTGLMCYLVTTDRIGDDMRHFAAGLPDATLERTGVFFKHHESLLYLSQAMERLIGVPAIDYHTFEVVRVAYKHSQFEVGRTYLPGLRLDRICEATSEDVALNERRKLEFLSRLNKQQVEPAPTAPGL